MLYHPHCIPMCIYCYMLNSLWMYSSFIAYHIKMYRNMKMYTQYIILYSCHNTTHTLSFSPNLFWYGHAFFMVPPPTSSARYYPPSCVWHLQTMSIFPVLFFCWLFCFTVLHGKGFISSSFKHLSRCTLITECLKHPSRRGILNPLREYCTPYTIH